MAPALSGIRDEGGVVMKDHWLEMRIDAGVALQEAVRNDLDVTQSCGAHGMMQTGIS